MRPGDPRDARWIKHASWHESRDPQSWYKRSSIGRTADFSASVEERYAWRTAGREYTWRVTRQRTVWEERQPGWEPSMTHWDGDLAHGVADTMPHARSAAMRAMKALRASHIEAGGDVGYPSYMELEEREVARR